MPAPPLSRAGAAPTAPALLRLRGWTLYCCCCCALAALAYLTPPSILDSYDFRATHELMKRYAANALLHGRLPLWDPHVGLGRPFLADIESALFYPPGLLFALLGPRLGFATLACLHSALAAAGTALLAARFGARRSIALGAGLAYALGAPLTGCFLTGQVQYGIGLCWVPVILLLAVRLQDHRSLRGIVALAIASSLQVLSGHQQAVWLTDIGAVTLLVARGVGRPWPETMRSVPLDLARFSAAVVWGFALSAVQLLPFFELVGQGNRSTASLQFAASFSMPAEAWQSLALTMTPGRPLAPIFYVYSGVAVLLAGGAGLTTLRDRNLRALFVLALTAAVIAAGETTPAFRWAYHCVPGLSMFRIHARMTVLIALALVVAGSVWLSAGTGSRPRVGLLALAAGGLPAVVLASWQERYGVLALAAVTALLLAVLRTRTATLGRAAVASILATLFALDVGLSTWHLKQYSIQPSGTEREEKLASEMRATGMLVPGQPPPRVSFPGVRANAGLAHGWSTFDHYGFVTARVWSYLHRSFGREPPQRNRNQPSRSIYQHGPVPYRTMAIAAVTDGPTGQLTILPAPDARAYVAQRATLVSDADEAMRRIRAGHDASLIALVEKQDLLPSNVPEPPSGASPDTARFAAFAAERLELDVDSAQPGLLVIKEAWFPGWTATVNGRPTPCGPANVWMRAVPVPAGHSRVVLQYHSTYLRLGAAVSLAALVALLLACTKKPASRNREAG